MYFCCCGGGSELQKNNFFVGTGFEPGFVCGKSMYDIGHIFLWEYVPHILHLCKAKSYIALTIYFDSNMFMKFCFVH